MNIYTKNVNIAVPDEIHKEIKKIAAENGQTIKGLLIQLMKKEIEKDGKN